MKLYVMRHGPAEDYSSSGRDGDRALTPTGRDRVRSVARVLVDADEAPLLVVTSPLVRALQTAEIVAAVTKLTERGGTVETRREMEPGGGAIRLVQELAAAGKKRVMLVGHEPDVAALVVGLSGFPMPGGMQKAMVVGLHYRDGGEATDTLRQRIRVRLVLDPKALTIERLDA